MMSAAVDVLEVSKSFRGPSGDTLQAVDRLTFSIPEGCIFGLLGPNGSGKSTTIKLMLGLLKPTRGICRFWGVPADQPMARAEVGYTPESPRFSAHMTGRDVLKYFGKLSGMSGSRLDAQAERLLVEAGLQTAGDRRVANYSKGMLQRLGLAQALVHDPRLLILDEPASGLDPEGVEQLSEHLLALKAAGKTILLTSHHIAQIGRVCDRVAVLERGRLLFQEEVPHLLSKYPWHDLRAEQLSPAQLSELKTWFHEHRREMTVMESETKLSEALRRRFSQAKEIEGSNG